MVPRVTVAFVCWLAILLSPSAAPYLLKAQEEPAQPPTFRTGIDVVQLDVPRALFPTADLPLAVAAAPFATPTRGGATIVLAVGAGGDESTGSNEPPAAARTEHVEIFVAAYDPDGSGVDWARQRFDVRFGGSGNRSYEALARLDVKPGRYEVRVGARHETSGRTVNVHGYVEVPDFARERVSLSGVVLHDPQVIHVTPASAFGDLLPEPPTIRRVFSAYDEVTALVRVSQRRSGPATAVDVSFRVVNDMLDEVWSQLRMFGAAEFDFTRSVEARVQLPLANMAAGSYVLVVEATRDRTSTRREVRFAVR